MTRIRPRASILDTAREPTVASPNSSTRPLFLPSDDEEGTAATTEQSSANKTNPDVDALFEGLDDIDDSFQELAPALDLDALRREADARNTRAHTRDRAFGRGSGSGGVKNKGGKSGPLGGMDGNEDGKEKKRKPVPKLDETRLLGLNGFPRLVKDTKNFKPKGKGHEATDLDRVLQLYQFWTHKLYPKTRFKETVDRVEKLCHSKRMQVSLSVWRDEAKGLVNGVRPSTADNDSDSDAPRSPRGDADQSATSSNQPSSADHLISNSEDDSDGLPVSSDTERPPPSSPDRDEAAAAELDALLEEEEAAQRASVHTGLTGHAWKKSQMLNGDAVMDEDVELWDALGTDAPTSASTMAPRPPPTDEDEEMWDIVREFEQEQEKTAARESNPASLTPTAEDTQADDLDDDLYL
ncbi:replication fork protection component Swi3-domain-containing protein [Lactifluus volemus]|nr:replication fork protection component Swi3-domain-containing protein [Lactifluus volemus]